MAKPPRLSKGASLQINSMIDDLFDNLAAKAMGKISGGKTLRVGFKRDLSIPGVYEQAVSDEGGYADKDIIDRLVEITNDFLDQHRAKAKGYIKKQIQDSLQELGGLSAQEFKEKLSLALHDVWSTVTVGIKAVIETQGQHAQTLGIKEGIDTVNSAYGVEDPIVFWVIVRDGDCCDECRKIHMMPDGVMPRLWRSSEVDAGYHTKGTDRPSWSGLHPWCRCAPSTLLPGYGFNEQGKVAYKASDHDALDEQRSEETET